MIAILRRHAAGPSDSVLFLLYPNTASRNVPAFILFLK